MSRKKLSRASPVSRPNQPSQTTQTTQANFALPLDNISPPQTRPGGVSGRIGESIQVNTTPGSPNGIVPAIRGNQTRITANPQQEYVAASSYSYYLAYIRSLPWSIDALTDQFGPDLYDRMMTHPQVNSCVNVLKSAVLEDGLHLTPAVDKKADKMYGDAEDMMKFYDMQLNHLEPNIDEVMWNLTDAFAVGNKAAELVFDLFQGKYILRAIKVKPRESLSYVVNPYNDVIGCLARIPGVPYPVQNGTILLNPDMLPNLITRQKFLIYSFRPRDGDPRGTTVLNPAFDPWQRAMQIKPDHMSYLSQFASASLIGKTSPEAMREGLVDSNNNPVLDETGNQVMVEPEVQMANSLAGIHNGSVVAFQYGAEVTPLNPIDSEAFDRAFARFDMEITKAITNQILATEEGAHMARAASQVHYDVMSVVVQQIKNPLVRRLRHDLLETSIENNFGEMAARLLTPKVTLGKNNNSTLAALLPAWSGAGWKIDPSQFSAVDAKFDLPPRDVEQPLPQEGTGNE